MIGMVNVPCDSPLDFYASPSRQDSVRRSSEEEGTVPRTPTSKRKSTYRPVFNFSVHRKKVQYAKDGRKITDGVQEQGEPNKLWEELLLRSFAQRIEDEIQSPVTESFKNLDEELSRLNVQDKSIYRSTYSLVSANRVEHTSIEELEDIEKRNKRSSSTERGQCSMFVPFIKSIKGKKRSDKKKE